MTAITRMKAFLGRLAGDRRATSTIEMALVLPSLVLLLAGMSDFAMGFSLKLHTQQAAARTIEYATSAGLEQLSFDDLRSEAAMAAHVPTDQVTVLRWLECNGARQTLFDGSCESGQEIARYVSIRISNSYEPVLGALLPESVVGDGTIGFVGFSTVRLQ
jgi:hypothetical protein